MIRFLLRLFRSQERRERQCIAEAIGAPLACTAERCTVQAFHSLCAYQTAIADKRHAGRQTIRQRRGLANGSGR